MSTYRSTGTVATNSDGSALSPGAPAGKSVGDQLRLVAWQRSTATVAAITGWTQLGAISGAQSLEIWGRIADGTATDTPSVDWSGTGSCGAFIEAYHTGVYTDMATLVAHSATISGNANSLQLPVLTGGSVNNCEVYAVSRKNNTATDATTISHASLTVRTQVVSVTTARSHVATGTAQQTTYTDYDGTDFTVNGTAESLTSNGMVLYLRTGGAVTNYLKLLASANAASVTDVEGVVLNAARDTVIGEFTGQAFEASLEGGEAVLLIDVADITPDGSTLTTSDTPIVFAYNSTDGTVGEGSATVIEV